MRRANRQNFLMQNLCLLGIILASLCFVSCRTKPIITKNEKIGIPPSKVIFTFDDGPNKHNDITERLLDVFCEYQIKGVFCLLGINALKYPEIVRRIYNEGHTIVIHGHTDKFSIFMKEDEFRNNLFLTEQAITEILGTEIYPKLYRPQGGFYKKWQQKVLIEEGYIIVPFTVRVLDVFTTTKGQKRLTKKIINTVKKQNGGIILLHEGRGAGERREKRLNKSPQGSFNRSWIPDTVEEIIKTLMDSGFLLNDSLDLQDILLK